MVTKYIMLLNYLKQVPSLRLGSFLNQQRSFGLKICLLQTVKHQERNVVTEQKAEPEVVNSRDERIIGEIFPTARVVPMVLTNKEAIVLPFDDVPGPKSLKYFSNLRNYLSEIGTQITVGVLTFGLNINAFRDTRKSLRNLSVLFDEYGPVVRFVSPVGNDIVLINHPDHIQKVYTMEGEYPVRSTLDSLEKYRMQHRNHTVTGLYNANGQNWSRQRNTVYNPLHSAVAYHLQGVDDVCESFAQKIYNMRNYQDEISKDLYKELHKWAFDSMGLVLFSKKFTMLDTELVYSQCDMSWLYHSLDKATDAIVKCESGLHMWKFFTTPAWSSLVKYCDSLDNLIGKHVMEAEQSLSYHNKDDSNTNTSSLINAMLLGEEKMSAEDISTVIMDLLLIGVNTITSSTSFLLYYLSKHQRVQKLLQNEIESVYPTMDKFNLKTIRRETPYLQACIKETLRLVPPIPVLTRVLPKNITLDKYNIPQGTLILMSPQDASLKESNYEDANVFRPARWLGSDSKDYHAFSSIPFGFGARRCLGQNIAETMMSMLTIRILQKYKLSYHYGDIEPKQSFIAKPNRPLKIRFVDRM